MSDKNVDPMLDRAIEEIRDSEMDSAAEQRAADQVWAKLSSEIRSSDATDGKILGHEDFQALIPAYLHHELSSGKQILFEDHVGECLPCRRALKEARLGAVRKPTTAHRQRSALAVWGWRAVAAAIVIVSLVGLDIQTELFTIQAEGLIEIERVEGRVFQVTDEGTAPVKVGDKLSFDQVRALRTGKDSNAVFRMSDDSVVEMDERAELAVFNKKKFWQRGRGDGLIDLQRGNIIVEASDQGAGHLYVDTSHANVAVTGTVFAVNSGVKGSRVSVLEGSVEVGHGGTLEALTPGQQMTTGTLLGHTRIEDEIAWSQDKLRHLALLATMTRALSEIETALDWPGLRYDTALLDRAPENTAIYIAIPNISDQIATGFEMMQTKIAENELLSSWWSDELSGTETEDQIAEFIGQVQSYGASLGTEVVIALPHRDGNVSDPVILAELVDEKGFGAMVQQTISEKNANVVLIEGALPEFGPAAGADMYLWAHEGQLVAAHDTDTLRALANRTGSFEGSTFHDSLSGLYRDGAGWIVAADLATLMPDNQSELEMLGLADMQHAIIERKQKGERTESRFVVSFDQPRKGLASWLAEPAPLGSLDFVSGNASFAAAFLMRDPSAVIDELFGLAGANNVNFGAGFAEFENETGINLQDDLLAALGGEFAIAFDGPVVPVPSWKVIVEVYDPGRLQDTMERLVELVNTEAQAAGANIKGFALHEHGSGRNQFYEIESLDVGLSVHYKYVDGFLVAGSSRALINRALANRRNGITLVNSPKFQAALPADSEINFSAVVYQDLGSVLGPFARTLGAMTQQLSQDQQNIVSQFAGTMEPSVTLAYGQTDRIVFVNSQQGGFLSSTLGSFLRLNSLMGMQELLTHAAGERTGH